jgi:hypothetical protein
MKYTVWTAVEAVRAAGGPWVGAAAHSLTLRQQATRDTLPLSMKYTVWTAVEAVRAAGGPWVGAAAHSLALGQQAARLRLLAFIVHNRVLYLTHLWSHWRTVSLTVVA